MLTVSQLSYSWVTKIQYLYLWSTKIIFIIYCIFSYINVLFHMKFFRPHCYPLLSFFIFSKKNQNFDEYSDIGTHWIAVWVNINNVTYFDSFGVEKLKHLSITYHPLLCKIKILRQIFPPKIMKYWVGVQRGHSYLMGRRCLFSLGWPPF